MSKRPERNHASAFKAKIALKGRMSFLSPSIVHLLEVNSYLIAERRFDILKHVRWYAQHNKKRIIR